MTPNPPNEASTNGLILQPSSKEDLSRSLRAAHDAGQRVAHADLRALPPVLTHVPEDMTVTVAAGVTLADLQAALRPRGQWLPIDPPNPGRLTVGALLATNASGPRRFGYGGIRDHLIGLEVALGDGRLVHSGGKVVKNVAGYDLLKLFIGDHGSLGLVVEATFKLLPVPEAEQFVQACCHTLPEAGSRIESVLDSAMTPVVLDLHSLSTLRPESGISGSAAFTPLRGPDEKAEDFAHRIGHVEAASRPRFGVHITLGFAGTREEVEWQLAQAAPLGFSEAGTLDYEAHFHAPGLGTPLRASVLPSRLVEFIGTLAPESFVARAGNGVIHYRGGQPAPKDDVPLKLVRRIKETFDPKHVFPDAPP